MDILLGIPTYVLPLTVLLLMVIVPLIPPLTAALGAVVEIAWITRDRKISETTKSWAQRQWDKKTDEQILAAYDDACGWLDISYVTVDVEGRLEDYILPQMAKRGLPYV